MSKSPDIKIADLVLTHDIPRLRRDLLAWFDASARDLPWRSSPSVYGTWISEIMLQQTTVAAVEPRWHAFLNRFPDVIALADADETSVLEAWQGLGYYRRARQLHAAARTVRDQLNGCLPLDQQGWRSLPGIGPYTAGAISSIGLGLPEAAVDTNVDRILRRLVCDTEQLNNRLNSSAVRRLAQTFLDPTRPGDWNQGLMDLGARLCSPVSPSCDDCPLSSGCVSYQFNVTGKIPALLKRQKPTSVSLSILVAHDQNGYLIVSPGADPVVKMKAFGPPARSHYDKLYRGYCQFPTSNWIVQPSGEQATAYISAIRTAWAHWLSPANRAEMMVAGSYSHTITRYRLAVTVIACTSFGPWENPVPVHRWQEGRSQYPLATLSLKALSVVSHSKEY